MKPKRKSRAAMSQTLQLIQITEAIAAENKQLPAYGQGVEPTLLTVRAVLSQYHKLMKAELREKRNFAVGRLFVLAAAKQQVTVTEKKELMDEVFGRRAYKRKNPKKGNVEGNGKAPKKQKRKLANKGNGEGNVVIDGEGNVGNEGKACERG